KDVVNEKAVSTVIQEMHEERLGGEKKTKKIELPRVKTVNAPDSHAAEQKAGAVIVPISEARADTGHNDKPKSKKSEKGSRQDVREPSNENEMRMVAPAEAPDGEGKVADRQPIENDDAIVSSSLSVLDRLRAGKAKVSASKSGEAPASATLKDVASAIAAAGSNQAGDGENSSTDDFDVSDTDSESASTDDGGAEWRTSLIRSIDNTRDDLRQAHASVDRLRTSLADMKNRRAEKRKKAIKSLARAETILSELRDAWK
ncbi:MAG: hypothetical protein KJN99_12330, partial [Marinicaulis sp.]|nr:hypothetical protein [Marinicaulis sp.]